MRRLDTEGRLAQRSLLGQFQILPWIPDNIALVELGSILTVDINSLDKDTAYYASSSSPHPPPEQSVKNKET